MGVYDNYKAVFEGFSYISISDISGRLIEKHENINVKNGEIANFKTINNLTTGVYFIQINVSQSTYHTKLIIN